MHLNSENRNLSIKWKQDGKEHMEIREKNGVPYLIYPSFEQFSDFCHGFSTRLGGISEGFYSSLNLSFTRGDREDNVLENYRRIADAIGFSLEGAVCSDQTHTTNVRRIYGEDAGKGIFSPKTYEEIDGLITNEPGITLVTSYADCVPLYFLDPVHKAIGLSHSGWRGTAGKIGAKTLKRMKEEFGSKPEEMYAAIGPSICQDCYEVSEDVAEAFREAFPKNAEESELLYRKENGKYQLNLWRANELVLLEAGISSSHLFFSGLCTCCNPEFLFSHRASSGKRGNLCAFLGIRNQ